MIHNDDERPVWLDLGTLKDEKADSFTDGVLVGMVMGWFVMVCLVLVMS